MGTTNYHTPVSFGASSHPDTINGPLGELDQALTNLAASVGESALAITVTDATASAGQKVVPVAATTGFLVGEPVWIGDVSGTFEIGVVASIQAGVSLTMNSNLTNTYAAGKIVSASPSEVADARAGAASLKARLDAMKTIIRVTKLTYGTATYTPTAGTHALFVECIGAGGGGGGCATAATNAAAAGGGGGGAYAASWLSGAQIKPLFNVSVGGGGAGGLAGANPGTGGGDTSFDDGTILAKGGGAGVADTVAAGPRLGASGSGSGADPGQCTGDIRLGGGNGDQGIVLSATQARSGAGGDAARGGNGGKYVFATGTGAAGRLYGGGGSGACILSGGASQAGGAGAHGLIIVWEF